MSMLRLPLQHMTRATTLLALEENMIAYMRYCSHLPGALVHDAHDHISLLTGLPQPALNVVLRSRFSLSTIESRITEVLTPFKKRQLPLLWWLFPGSQPTNLTEYLERHDLYSRGKDPAMALDLSTLPATLASPLSSSLTIEEVQDALTLHEWIHTSATAFGSPVHTIDPDYLYFEQTLGIGSTLPYRRFLARLDARPVATSALFLGAGVAGLFSVGTIPAARQQGIGRAISLAPLLVARELGYRVAVLQSTPSGYSVYYSLGFRTCCHITSYVWYPL